MGKQAASLLIIKQQALMTHTMPINTNLRILPLEMKP